MAELQGAPGYRYVTTPHPMAILSADEIRLRAEAVVAEVVSLVTDPPHEIRTPPPRFHGDPEEAG